MAEEDLSPGLAETVRALAAERGPCPSADALVEYHELGAAARAAHPIDAHVQICSRCQLTLLHLQEEPAIARRFSWTWVAVAAAALLAVALPMLMRPRPAPPAAATIRGSELQPVSPIGDVPAVTTFAWQTPSVGLRYDVNVYRGTERVWTATPIGDATSVGAGNLRLEPGVEYQWRVEGRDVRGDVRMTSPLQKFRITGGR
jgi:hypothetical protein